MCMVDPATVINAIVRGANDGDIDSMLNWFADDAVLRLEPALPPPTRQVYSGKLQIREYLQALLQNGFHVEASDFRVVDSGVTWHSRISSGFLRRLGADPAETTSHAALEGAVIRSLTVHYSPEALHRMHEALATQAR